MNDDKQYILAQDIGIYSCKATLFSFDGEAIRSNTVRYSPDVAADGRSSQSPDVWWDAYCLNCRNLLTNIPADSVKAVCVCGQMMGCLALGRDGRPLYEHMTWDDKRSADQICKIESLLSAEKIHEITGVCLSHMFSLSKIMWLKERLPNIYNDAAMFVQCKDYINYRLTGVLATDESDAGFTLMYDLLKREWSDTILDACGIDAAKLPEVVHFGTVLGRVTPDASEQCGLSQNTIVVEGMGDGRAPAVGSGLVEKGQGLIYMGSVSWVSQITDSAKMDRQNVLTKSSYTGPELFLNGGTVLSGGLSVDWFLKTFYPNDLHTKPFLREELFERMNRTPIGSNGLLFMPYLRGERTPWWNSYAKGGFIGLDMYHTREEFFRSVIEGVSFQLAIVKRSIEELEPFSSLYLSGGVATPHWQQLLSDAFEMNIVSTDVKGGIGCVGAAVAAGVGLGIYRDYSEASRFHRSHYYTSPISENVELYRDLIPVFEDCYNALQDINQYLCHVHHNHR